MITGLKVSNTEKMTLSELKQQLKHFKVVPCELYHELVALDKDSGLPLKTDATGTTLYQRVSLCDVEERKQRLGCAHSVSNVQYNNLLNALDPKDDTITALQETFNKTVLNIYKLDHDKGDLEKAYAETLEPNYNGRHTIEAVNQRIADCKAVHNSLMKTLEDIRVCINERIDQLIAE